jgi:hypothetical protein
VARAGALVGVPTPVNACLAGLLDRVVVDPVLRASLANRPERIAAHVAGTASGVPSVPDGE